MIPISSNRDSDLGCFTPFMYLHHMTQLIELNKYFEDLLPIVLKIDIKDGLEIKPFVDIKHENDSPTVIHGSKERSNVFYWHKFQLALSELRSSSEVNIYTKELHHIFIERIEHEIINVERNCRKVQGLILEKLSLDKQWEALLQLYEDDESLRLDDVSRKMAENCDVSKEELPSFIAYLERCRQILMNLSMMVLNLDTDNQHLVSFMVHCFDDSDEDDKREVGWEAFHVLTFLDFFYFYSLNISHVLLNFISHNTVVACENGPNPIGIGQIRSEVGSTSQINHKRSNQSRSDEEAKEKNENVEALERSVEYLKIIGDSDVRPDEEELKMIFGIMLHPLSTSFSLQWCMNINVLLSSVVDCLMLKC